MTATLKTRKKAVKKTTTAKTPTQALYCNTSDKNVWTTEQKLKPNDTIMLTDLQASHYQELVKCE